MGNSVTGSSGSHTDPSLNQDDSQFDGVETLGYRVLGVQPNSPASKAGLVSFFDFLVGANGLMLFNVDGDHEREEEGVQEEGKHEETDKSVEKIDKEKDDDEFYVDIDFPAFLKQNMDTEIELLVYNIKSKTQRIIPLTPTNKWEGTGLLGVTIRADDYAAAEDRLLRILYVEKNSPAAIAGLTPLKDYLLGTTTESFENEDILAHVLQCHMDRVFEVYVYNTETDLVRVVSIMPTLSWGGRGLLGCEVGRGYLHRLPSACRMTNGISFERKIRMGARSTTSTRSKALSPETSCNAEMITTTTTVNDEDTKKADSSSMTCAISGNIVHAEPHIELELETETDERKFVTLTEITAKGTTPLNIGDLPPPPYLLYDFGKMDDVGNEKEEFSMNQLPPLPTHF